MNRYKIYLLLLIISISGAFVMPPFKPKPTIFLIGDSTVRNGTLGNGAGGLWGWGSFFPKLFDTTLVKIQNKAMGGTNSRTYTAIGLWDIVLADLRPGDFVIMQFGHNDNGKTAVRGNGEDTVHIINQRTGKMEIVHSFGWNIRKYISDTKARGATPIVCSLVPRNRWANGKVIRDSTHRVWAMQAAQQEGAWYIDLNTIVADHYDSIGEDKVTGAYFTEKDAVHTIAGGAIKTAALVAEGLRQLRNSPLQKYMVKNGKQ